MLGMARLLLLAHAVSVLSESVPAPSEPPGCTHLIVTTVTVADASEVSWVRLGAGEGGPSILVRARVRGRGRGRMRGTGRVRGRGRGRGRGRLSLHNGDGGVLALGTWEDAPPLLCIC